MIAAFDAIVRQWNVIAFIAGLMGISAAADESGAFGWITATLLAGARGSRRRLFVYLFLTGALLTLALSNDATAIVLTPIVCRAVVQRDDLDAKPFLLACAFVANTASFGLPFSNPTNVLILPHPQLMPYVERLGVPQLAAIAISLGIFLFFFRRQLAGRYEAPPSHALGGREACMLLVLAGIALAYVVALAHGWALGPVALVGAAAAIAVAGNVVACLRHVSWSTLALLAALFVVFDVLDRSGLVTAALHGIEAVSRDGTFALYAIAAGGAALLSNLFNNLPVAVAASYVSAHNGLARLSYPLIAGVALGPNLLVFASLSTILWAGIVRRYGVRVSAWEYLKLGALVVPPCLAVAVLWLALTAGS